MDGFSRKTCRVLGIFILSYSRYHKNSSIWKKEFDKNETGVASADAARR
jgi:hypothetical protein